MLNPMEFLPSAFLCLHKLSLNIVSQKRVENKRKNVFLPEYTLALVTQATAMIT